MTELPKGWVLCTIADTMEFTIGGVWGAPAGDAEVDVDVIRVTEMKPFGRLAPETAARRSVTMSQLGSRSLQAGDLILEKSGGGPNTPVGRVGLVTRVHRPAVCSNFMQLLRPNRDVVTPRFLLWQLVNAHLAGVTASLQTATTNIRNLKMKDYWEIQLRVPPLAEQERIVLALEEAFSKLNAGEAGVSRALELIKRMREAVLVAALSGRLVESDPTAAPAGKLLAELGLDPFAPEDVPALPAGWEWAPLGAIADVAGGLTKDSKRQHDPAFVERPYLRVANVQRGYLDLTEVTTIRVAPDKAAKLELQPGDVLFNEGGDRDKLGRGWVWEGQVAGCIHQNHVFRARLANGIEPRFVSIWGNTFGRGWFDRHGRQTTNLASINLQTLKSFPVPIGPTEEQVRILAEVDRYQSFLDACEASVDAGLTKATALRRAVLKSAFDGRLVPQDASDDPASAVLDRVRAERTTAPRLRRSRATA